MKRFKVLTILFLFLMFLSGCNKDSYVIPETVLDVLGIDATEYSKDIRNENLYDGTYDDIYSQDGNLIFIVTDEQMDELSYLFIQNLEYYKYAAEQYGMEFQYNDNFTQLILKCKKEQFGKELTEEGVRIFVAGVAWSQALTGVKPEDLYVYGVVKDIETDEIIYEYELYGRLYCECFL